MKSNESRAVRLEMVDMHKFFLDKIEYAVSNGDYFQSSWLVYSCLENRYFRTISKFKNQCKYCTGKSNCKKKNNSLSINTKIKCIQRLYEHNVLCITQAFHADLFQRTLNWTKTRNKLMHDLLALNEYQSEYDDKFKTMSDEGYEIIHETYDACTKFREIFYADGYEFVFPEECMEDCRCKPKEKK